ncbi:MAG: inositol monophosphatase [Candidatus Aenigmatarchaeota archaeon]
MKRILFSAVKKVGKYLKEVFYNREGIEKVEMKNNGDFSIKADLIAEEIYLSEFSNLDVKIITEEKGTIGNESDILIIDPLDGTINFHLGIPIFCTQIAFLSQQNISIIYLPITKELFFSINKKSFLNKKEIKVSEKNDLNKAIIDFGTKAIIDEKLISLKCLFRRCFASAGISLAYTASSKIDASIMKNCFIWDYMPGKILVENAGGKFLEFNGEYHFDFEKKNLIAGNKNIVKKIIEHVNNKNKTKKLEKS